jgi:hypothetical protein
VRSCAIYVKAATPVKGRGLGRLGPRQTGTAMIVK